jgi:hypothetical protein
MQLTATIGTPDDPPQRSNHIAARRPAIATRNSRQDRRDDLVLEAVKIRTVGDAIGLRHHQVTWPPGECLPHHAGIRRLVDEVLGAPTSAPATSGLLA